MDNIVASNIELARKSAKEKFKSTFGTLKRKIIDPGLCIECGKCVVLCDVIDWDAAGHQPALVGKCIACGLCYHQCPISPGSPIGDFDRALVTRNTIDGFEGQDGGTVTAMVTAMLEAGILDCAILTRHDPAARWHPAPFIATTREEVISGAGTIYSNSPVVPVLLEAVEAGHRKIAVVTTACKIDSINDLARPGEMLDGIEGLQIYKIGLFCSESFVPERLLAFIEQKVDPARVKKMKISNGMLWATSEDGTRESFGLTSFAEEFHQCTKHACMNCKDFAADDADVSIGNVGSTSKDNTALVRTAAGAECIDVAIERGLLAARDATKEELKPVMELAWLKRERGVIKPTVIGKQGKFKEHEPGEWNVDEFDYSPAVHVVRYKRLDHVERVVNRAGDGPKVLVAAVPEGDEAAMTAQNYSTAYDLTRKLLEDKPYMSGGKVFIKPNNTGFVGIFKHNPKLAPILAKNGITDDADHQPLATQPATLKGIVDAMLDLGVKKIHVGENMLWDGGTPRAFYETGYCDVFSGEKYEGKVFFVDFYEDDPPPTELQRLKIKRGKTAISDHYRYMWPPKAFFEEKYDLVYVASIAKAHNCSTYSLTTKNFSISLNPRKKTGKIEPRWHVHGVPIDLFRKQYLKELFGREFKRKFQYLLRETYPHKWGANLKEKVVKPAKSKVILTGRETSALAKSIPATLHSSGLMAWFKSSGNWALNVDPHHWAGTSLLATTLGIGLLTERFTGMYATMVDALKENGTEVAGFISGIVGQEGDGPLIYGNSKHGGFAVAGFDAAATEKISLDIMFGTGPGGIGEALAAHQKALMESLGIDNAELLAEARETWGLQLLAELTGGVAENDEMNIELLDYTGTGRLEGTGPRDLYKVRAGAPFVLSRALHVSPRTWLRLIHLDGGVFKAAFLFDLKSIEIPLIPSVVG